MKITKTIAKSEDPHRNECIRQLAFERQEQKNLIGAVVGLSSDIYPHLCTYFDDIHIEDCNDILTNIASVMRKYKEHDIKRKALIDEVVNLDTVNVTIKS